MLILVLFQVTICLKNFTKSHKAAIVLSILQPSEDLLIVFDKLYVLSLGGRCIYDEIAERRSK